MESMTSAPRKSKLLHRRPQGEPAFLAAVFIFLWASVAHAATFTVTNTNDSGSGSLRDAIQKANSALTFDTIAFDPGIYTGGTASIALTGGTITITDSLQIISPSGTRIEIDANELSRIFIIAANKTVTVARFSLRRGRAPSATTNGTPGQNGGGVFVSSGADLGLDDVAFYGCRAGDGFPASTAASTGGSGGAIWLENTATLTARDSTFDGNSAGNGGGTGGGGGGNGGDGGAIAISTGTVTLNNCRWTNNTAGRAEPSPSGFSRGGNGGSISVAGTLIMNGGTMVGNAAGTARTMPGRFNNTGQGGAIYSTSGIINGIRITNVTFSGNYTPDGEPGNHSSSGYGGAVYSTGPISFSGCVFSNNFTGAGGNAISGAGSPAGQGGALYCGANLSLTQCDFIANHGGNGGNGVGSAGGAGGSGGAVYVNGPFTYSHGVVRGNYAGRAGIPGGSNAGPGRGGGLFITSSNATISDVDIVENYTSDNTPGTTGYSPGDGGGILSSASLKLVRVSLSNNHTGSSFATNGTNGGSGGGIYSVPSSGGLTIQDSTISGNYTGAGANGATGGAGGSGGGMYSLFSSLVMSNCTISGNSTGSGGSGSNTGGNGGSGGGIYSVSSTTCRNVTITNNSTGQGGMGALQNGLPGAGGGLYGYSGNVILANTIVSANRVGAASYGDLDGAANISGSYNLIGIGGLLLNGINGNKVGFTEPLLSSLADHGGPAPTHLMLPASPARNAGSNALALDVDGNALLNDERGSLHPRIQEACVDIGSTEAAPPISIVGWRSVRSHGIDGALSISVNSAASASDATIETRTGGIQRVEVDLSGPATLSDPSAVVLTGQTSTGGSLVYTPSTIEVSGTILTLTFESGLLPDRRCFNIQLQSGATEPALVGDLDTNIRALEADVTGNGTVNLGDAIALRAFVGHTANAQPALDVDLSGGSISLEDVLVAKTRVSSPDVHTVCR